MKPAPGPVGKYLWRGLGLFAVLCGAFILYIVVVTVPRRQLTLAAYNGDLSRVRWLVAAGVDINARPRDWDGAGDYLPPLLLATLNGHADVVKFLLEHGANTETGAEDTPLLIAVLKGREDIATMLLDHGANPNVRGEGTPLMSAIDENDVKMVELLLGHGADPNFRTGYPDGQTHLSEAEHEANAEIVDLLKSHGAK